MCPLCSYVSSLASKVYVCMWICVRECVYRGGIHTNVCMCEGECVCIKLWMYMCKYILMYTNSETEQIINFIFNSGTILYNNRNVYMYIYLHHTALYNHNYIRITMVQSKENRHVQYDWNKKHTVFNTVGQSKLISRWSVNYARPLLPSEKKCI